MKAFAPVNPAATPLGFHHAPQSGLILPEAVARERQVWTKQEYRLLERLTGMLGQHGVDLLLQCQHPACSKTPLEPSRLPDGGFRLRCAHMDRVMTKAF